MRERDFLSRSRQRTETAQARRIIAVRAHAPAIKATAHVDGVYRAAAPVTSNRFGSQQLNQVSVQTKPKPKTVPHVQAKQFTQATGQRPRPTREASRTAQYQRRTPQMVRARNELTPRPTTPHVQPVQRRQRTEKSRGGFMRSVCNIVAAPRKMIQEFRALSRPQVAMISGGLMIFLFGGVVTIMGMQANFYVEAQTKQVASAMTNDNAGDVPDETDPGESGVANYRVSDPHQPRYLSIPVLDIKSRVKALGTKSNNELKAPTNSYDTGWYEKGSKPGYNGATLINGHMHGPTKPGVFFNLKNLEKGDLIEVERGDGKVFLYQVVRMQQYDRDNVDMAAAMTPVEPGKQGLNLITCAGTLNRSDSSYQDRLVVFASRID